MKFLFSFTLLVLPLFLLLCVQIIRRNDELRESVFGKFLIGLFLLFAFMALATGVYLITQI